MHLSKDSGLSAAGEEHVAGEPDAAGGGLFPVMVRWERDSTFTTASSSVDIESKTSCSAMT